MTFIRIIDLLKKERGSQSVPGLTRICLVGRGKKRDEESARQCQVKCEIKRDEILPRAHLIG